MPKPVALIILDGWGHREETSHNAVHDAKTPVFDKLWAQCPHSLLEASGEAVGLPEGQIGNSEIGHTTIGMGATMDTDLVRINKAIRSSAFAENEVIKELLGHVQEKGSTLHVLGLVSPGVIHSHQEHLAGFLRVAVQAGIKKIAVHAFTDGRDTPPQSAAAYLRELESVLEEVGTGFIATVSGRFYAMDRDNRWERLARVEDALFEGKSPLTHAGRKASEVVQELYSEDKLDEHLEPMVFLDEGATYTINENDGVFLFNYRPDRVRMIGKKLIERSLNRDIFLATMTQYDPEFPVKVAFPQSKIETTLAAEISKAGLTQQHVAESEKFPHVTYFLNGGREHPHEGEEHVLLPSNKEVATYDLAPEMQAEKIADAAIERIHKGVDFTLINFANPDMVGHTANHDAIVTAVETVDAQLGRVVEAIQERGGVAFITADHGNAEVTFDAASGERHTSHTLNKVPAILVGSERALKDGELSDIAPTILELFNLDKPVPMTGNSLLI